MRRQTGRVGAAVVLTVLASSSFGQIVGVVQSSSSRLSVKAPGCSENGQAEPPVQKQPFTAELKSTTVQTLANGTTITRIATEVHAVDSQQRTFTSRTDPQFSPDQPGFTWSSVDDPVESTQAHWNSQSKTAQVLKLPTEAERHGCWSNDSGRYAHGLQHSCHSDRRGEGSHEGAGQGNESGTSARYVEPEG